LKGAREDSLGANFVRASLCKRQEDVTHLHSCCALVVAVTFGGFGSVAVKPCP
jgi:hypothetical protein